MNKHKNKNRSNFTVNSTVLGVLCCAFISILSFFSVISVSFSQAPNVTNEIIVRPGESIQAAVDRAPRGTRIVVESGTYVETVFIIGKEDLIVEGNPRAVLDGQGVLNWGFAIHRSRNIVIGTFDIQNFKTGPNRLGHGVIIAESINVSMKHSRVRQNTYGVGHFRSSGGLIASQNEINCNEQDGVLLGDTTEVKVAGNLINGNLRGVSITYKSTNNQVFENKVYNHASWGIGVTGASLGGVSAGTGNSVYRNEVIGNNPDFSCEGGGEWRENRYVAQGPGQCDSGSSLVGATAPPNPCPARAAAPIKDLTKDPKYPSIDQLIRQLEERIRSEGKLSTSWGRIKSNY